MRNKRKSRLSQQKTLFTPEHFYIMHYEGTTIYQLRDSETQVVVSTSTSLEGLLECLSAVLDRHKHYSTYRHKMDNLTEPAVSSRIASMREEEYKALGDVYSSTLTSIINKHNSKFSGKTLTPRPVPRVLEEKPVEIKPITRPKGLLKKRTPRFL